MRKLILAAVALIAIASCKKERECPGNEERTLSVAPFRGIKAGENFNITVQQGAAFSIKARGCRNDLDDLQLSVDNGGTLSIAYNHYENKRYAMRFTITLPVINAAVLSGASETTITGFGAQTSRLRTIVSGASKCGVSGLPPEVQIELSGASELTLIGLTTNLSGNVSGSSRLDAYPATTANADLHVSGASNAYVQVLNSLVALASGTSRIYYKGNPAHTQLEQSGSAKIIRG